jgi:hypothetical protein
MRSCGKAKRRCLRLCHGIVFRQRRMCAENLGEKLEMAAEQFVLRNSASKSLEE